MIMTISEMFYVSSVVRLKVESDSLLLFTNGPGN